MKTITKQCCGCETCKNVCPKEAITMIEDEKGFKNPTIDEKKCLNCDLCVNKCPLNGVKKSSPFQILYAVKNKNIDTRMKSSSGGVFNALAKSIIADGGYVFGAIYDKDLNVVHYGTNDINELDKFYGSKYVQSNIGSSYKKIKELLENNKVVLFVGTPCQVFGLIKFLNKEYENLITCDFVCHGVPSQKIFNDYKKTMEEKYKSKLTSINFRYKNNRDISNIKLQFENGKEYIKHNSMDRYYKLFLNNYILREYCFNCRFSNLNRVSDITIGDFWNIEKHFEDFDDHKGVSLCLINSNKGKRIFKKSIDNFDLKLTSVKKGLQHNLTSPTEKVKDYDDFWNYYNINGYSKAAKKYAPISLKVRIKEILFGVLNFMGIYTLIKGKRK